MSIVKNLVKLSKRYPENFNWKNYYLLETSIIGQRTFQLTNYKHPPHIKKLFNNYHTNKKTTHT